MAREASDEYRYEVQRIVDCGGDDVLVVGVEVGKGAMSGAEVRSVSYEVVDLPGGHDCALPRVPRRERCPRSRRAV